jgi:hypothetical protein
VPRAGRFADRAPRRAFGRSAIGTFEGLASCEPIAVV